MFDTLKYSKALESSGISRQQAEAHVRIFFEIVEAELVTKQDVGTIKQDLGFLRHDIEKLRIELVQVEYRLVIKLGAIVGSIVTLAIAVTAAIRFFVKCTEL
jgi:uncharacterized membrane protein YheB (UPF0754 family)